MKHLKQYEHTTETEYEKFAIWKKQYTDDLVIVKMTPTEKDKIGSRIGITPLLIYNKETAEIETVPYKSKITKYYKTYVDRHIIYTSNSLKNCKDKVELLMSQNKFNL